MTIQLYSAASSNCQSGVWRNIGGTSRIVSNYGCGAEVVYAWCGPDERVTGGGAAVGEIPGCPTIPGFTDRNGRPFLAGFTANRPVYSGALQGWAAGGSNLPSPGDNMEVYAICQRL